MARKSIKRLCRKSQDIYSGMKKLAKIRYEFGTGIAVGGPYEDFSMVPEYENVGRDLEERR